MRNTNESKEFGRSFGSKPVSRKVSPKTNNYDAMIENEYDILLENDKV